MQIKKGEKREGYFLIINLIVSIIAFSFLVSLSSEITSGQVKAGEIYTSTMMKNQVTIDKVEDGYAYFKEGGRVSVEVLEKGKSGWIKGTLDEVLKDI